VSYTDKPSYKSGDKPGYKSGDKPGFKRSFNKDGDRPNRFSKDNQGGKSFGNKPKTFSKGNFEVVKQDTPKPMQPMTRREKQKVSDLIKNLRLIYNKLMLKKKDVGNDEKHALVAEAISVIHNKYEDLLYKHDGCRLLQALLKYGNRP